METRKPLANQQIRIIESNPSGVHPTIKDRYERRVRFPDVNPCQEAKEKEEFWGKEEFWKSFIENVPLYISHNEPLKPFSEWKDSELEAYRFVTPSQWTLYGYAIVLQRCNAFGKWSYRYVLNRVLIQ